MSQYEHFVDVESSPRVGTKVLSFLGPVLAGIGLGVLNVAPLAVGISAIAGGVVAVGAARYLDRRSADGSGHDQVWHGAGATVAWLIATAALVAGISAQVGGPYGVVAAAAAGVLTVDSAVLVQRPGTTGQRVRATIQVAAFAAATVWAILG